jgi:hypothetical protein
VEENVRSYAIAIVHKTKKLITLDYHSPKGHVGARTSFSAINAWLEDPIIESMVIGRCLLQELHAGSVQSPTLTPNHDKSLCVDGHSQIQNIENSTSNLSLEETGLRDTS